MLMILMLKYTLCVPRSGTKRALPKQKRERINMIFANY
jgi:hypothetical protein